MTPFSRRRFLALGALPLLPRFGFAEDRPPAGAAFNPLAGKLYGELRKEKGNVFFSPYSISTALGMCSAGAQGETLAQIQKLLQPADDAAYREMTESFKAPKKNFELSTANAIWTMPGYPMKEDFTRRLAGVFDADAQSADFKKHPEAARKAINTWAEKKTRNKIKDLLAEGTITPMTRIVLANAIYFKAAWQRTFDWRSTDDEPFQLLNGETKKVPLMHQKGYFNYCETENAQVVQKYFNGFDTSFLAILPKDPAKFAAVESSLVETLLEASIKLKGREVYLWLPRFKMEAGYILNEPLKKLGITDAFNSEKADFSGMTSDSKELVLSHVAQKAFLDLNEEGAEAAAATEKIEEKKAALPEEQEKPKTFRADRPFLFAIRHEASGTVLFLGRYTMPA